MLPDDLPEGLTLAELRHIWGAAEAEDADALAEEDYRVNAERKIKHDVQ